MRELLFFATIASLVGTVFFVSLIELILSIRRRKINVQLQAKIKELKSHYNDSVNSLVVTDGKALEETEKKLEEVSTTLTKEKEELEATYKEKIDGITASSQKSVESAKAKAKKLEEEAKQQADEYMDARRKEVENELMDLVLSVSKKVLPPGISYDAHKELVMQALRDVKAESN